MKCQLGYRQKKPLGKKCNGYEIICVILSGGNFNPFSYEYVNLGFVLSQIDQMGQIKKKFRSTHPNMTCFDF